jgi:Protein of unknown function (DUF1488)
VPLTRGSIIGYYAGRMTFEFTMVTPDARIVECGISSSAMDCLIGTKGVLPQDREALFRELRGIIEQRASDIFDRKATHRIRIFSKDVKERSRRNTG